MIKTFRYGFSLLEIMVAMVVVSVLLAALAPVITSSASKKANEVNVQNVTKVIDSTPIGVIVGWQGTNVPEGWLPLDGRQIDPKYVQLKEALGGADTLPNYSYLSSPAMQEQLSEYFPDSGYNRNGSQNGAATLIWIIKAENKR